MQRLVGRGIVIAVGLAALALFLGHLLASDAILVVRDVPIFHVPLRAAFAKLAVEGLPAWNPSIHGGQPILSNPNYAAFYPPSWIALIVPAHRAVSWILLLHGALAFAGAWLAARSFGCGRAAATLTAVAFFAGGTMLSAASGVTTYCSASWLPWTLLWTQRLLSQPDRPLLSLRTALPGWSLAMQVLAGEPAIALASSLAVACLILTSSGTALRRVRRLAAVAVFAILLAAVQLAPTLAHVANSSRSASVDGEAATWSTSPVRLLEFALPRLHGDPMGLDDDLYFGWKLHDRNFPYLISIYPGQLVWILALAAFLRWPIRGRVFWVTLALVGLALALGRYNPLYARFASSLPLLELIRYPEKFLLLTTTAMAFGSGLGWQYLIDRRGAGDADGKSAHEDFAIAIAAVIALVILVLGLTLTMRPGVGLWFVQENTLYPPVGERLDAAANFLRRQAWVGLTSVLLALGILCLHRLRRVPVPVLVAVTLIGLGIDLAYYNRGLTPVIDYSALASPPNHLRHIDPSAGRVFTDEPFAGREGFQPRSTRPGPDALWSSVDRAEPYLGNLWGYSYVLHVDFDRMLTEPAGRALALLEAHWADEPVARRLLAAWGVGYLLRNRSVSDLTRARAAGQELDAVRVEPLPARNPLLSWERSVSWHATPQEAETAAARESFRSAHWVASSPSRSTVGAAPEAIRRLEAKSSSMTLEYSARATLLAVVNTTFDRGWCARLDGQETPVHRTVLGQIGLELPPGEHLLHLEFKTPYLRHGLAVSLLTVLAVAAAEITRRRRARFAAKR